LAEFIENNFSNMGPLSGRISRLLRGKMTSKKSSHKNIDGLIQPYGGELTNLMASDQKTKELKKNSFKTLNCSDRNACDFELLLIGAFSPGMVS
jgi:sulfate adenylyltransferase